MKTCIIKIQPDNEKQQADVQTGGVHPIDILQALKVLQQHFAREVMREFAELSGQPVESLNEEDFDNYVAWLQRNK